MPADTSLPGFPSLSPGFQIRNPIYHQLSFFIEEKVLSGQVDLHVSVAVVICPMARRLLGIPGSRRKAIIAASARLCRLVDLPAIRSAAYLNRGTIRCFQCFRFV